MTYDRDLSPDAPPSVTVVRMAGPIAVFRFLRWLGVPLWIALALAVRGWLKAGRR